MGLGRDRFQNLDVAMTAPETHHVVLPAGGPAANLAALLAQRPTPAIIAGWSIVGHSFAAALAEASVIARLGPGPVVVRVICGVGVLHLGNRGVGEGMVGRGEMVRSLGAALLSF